MRKLALLIAVLLVIGYGFFEARRLIGGPTITLTEPLDGTATSSTSIVISGNAQNISFLTINDAPAFTDEQGHFSETLSPPPGYAIFTVAATDRFGRRASSQVHITVLNYCSDSVS
ncbi:MAG TPA: hypothetical protein VHD31_00055 [Candidatus Paceibacterota bacterium]|nr:hypothetical protein [Candidatus Paceibacterota bacterium]